MPCLGASITTSVPPPHGRTPNLPLALTLVRANAFVQYGGAVYVDDSSDVLVDGAIFTVCAADLVRRAPAALLPSRQHGLALP